MKQFLILLLHLIENKRKQGKTIKCLEGNVFLDNVEVLFKIITNFRKA